MKIISWNVNGLRAAASKGFLMTVAQLQPDILCLQEVKAMPEQLPDELINIPGYHSYFNPAERKGYSGTAIYYKYAMCNEQCAITDDFSGETAEKSASQKATPNLPSLQLYCGGDGSVSGKTEKVSLNSALLSTGLSDERFNHEGRTIRMDLPEFTLFNIYFPNGGQGEERLQFKMDFYDCFLKDVNALVTEGKKVIICGDVNTAHREIDLKNPKANAKRSGFLPEERRFLDRFIGEGYIDTFRYFYPETVAYSWWSYRFNARANNAGWRIDYFFASENAKDLLADAAIYSDIQGSDHCPIGLTLV